MVRLAQTFALTNIVIRPWTSSRLQMKLGFGNPEDQDSTSHKATQEFVFCSSVHLFAVWENNISLVLKNAKKFKTAVFVKCFELLSRRYSTTNVLSAKLQFMLLFVTLVLPSFLMLLVCHSGRK